MITTALDVLRPSRDRSLNYFLRWCLFFAVICLGAVVLFDFGFLQYIYIADTSQISAIISILFLILSFYCAYLLLALTPELLSLATATAQFEADGQLSTERGALQVGNYILPPGHATTAHLRDIILKYQTDREGGRETLAHSLAASLRSRIRVGAIMADVLYKLGLLGTVIGFIVMLGSIGNLGQFDVETLRGALQAMSTGMAISLLTTIAGLVCGTLLRMQYMLAEGLVAAILQRTVRLTEVFIVPALKRTAGSV